MIFKEMLMDERREGKAESIIELLEDLGVLSEDLRNRIMEETDLSVLKKWLKLAAKAESLEQFTSAM